MVVEAAVLAAVAAAEGEMKDTRWVGWDGQEGRSDAASGVLECQLRSRAYVYNAVSVL